MKTVTFHEKIPMKTIFGIIYMVLCKIKIYLVGQNCIQIGTYNEFFVCIGIMSDHEM